MAHLIIGSDRASDFFAKTRELAPDLDARLWSAPGNIEEITTALAWGPPPGALATLPNLELIVSVGAGVDHLLKDPTLPDVPVVRYVDPDLTGRMAEYVTMHVLFHQRRMCEFLELQRAKRWQYVPEPAAHEVRVGLMGLGIMGKASARALSALGFQIAGWSRTPHAIEGVETFAGVTELAPFLARTDILVCLLPMTPDTRGILNRKLIQGLSLAGRHARMPGPVLINAGRGGLQVEADIAAALASGELYAASLDVFETEPLPAESVFWEHPRVIVTPHNAAESTPDAIVAYCLRQLELHGSGRMPENVVDRMRGY